MSYVIQDEAAQKSIQPWTTLKDLRNTTGGLLHSRSEAYTMRFIKYKAIRIVGHIQNSGLQSFLRRTGQVLSLDTNITEGSGTQGLVNKMEKLNNFNFRTRYSY